MTWIRVDDHFAEHPKVLALGRDRLAGLGLWTVGACYAGRYLTDGFVPSDVLPPGTQRLQELLVRVGLWDRARGGYVMHDFLEYNPTREKVLEGRAARKERARRAAAARWDAPPDATEHAPKHAAKHGTKHRAEHGVSTDVVHAPVPSRTPDGSTDLSEGVSAREAALSRMLRRSPSPRQLSAIDDWCAELGEPLVIATIEEQTEAPAQANAYGVLTQTLREVKASHRPARNGAAKRGELRQPAGHYDSLVEVDA